MLFKNLKAKGFLIGLSLITFGPIFILLIKSFSLEGDDQEAWSFLANNIVPELIQNTFFLLSGTLLGTLSLGIAAAFLMVFSNIPGKKIWHLFFILPLAFPIYVTAFVYAGIFDYSGPVLTFLREQHNISLSWLKVRSLFGACWIFSLSLFPYVYLLARNAFLSVGDSLVMSSRSLGKSPWQVFYKTILPYSRPWLIGAGIIISMETLADFGGVSALNLDTFTTAIYSAWSGFFSLATAARLSCLLILLALGMLYLEKHFNQKARYIGSSNNGLKNPLVKLNKKEKVLAYLFMTFLSLFSVFIPITQLALWALEAIRLEWSSSYLDIIFNTALIGFSSAIIIVLLAFTLTYINRNFSHHFFSILSSFSLFGYALPGNIIAVAVFLYFSSIQKVFDLTHLGTGSLFILIVGLAIRFLAVGYRPQENAAKRIPSNLDKAARSLGAGDFRLIKSIYFPLLSKAFCLSFLLIFIEVVKEMPMTLMLRPFNMNTLSVKIFELTSEGEWERASLSAVFLVFLGLIGTLIVSKLERQEA